MQNPNPWGDGELPHHASQILQASLTDPAIRFAVSSLRSLREDLETSEYFAVSAAKKLPSYGHDHGLQQYCEVLGDLAAKLSSPDSTQTESALFCCQLFISIEQARGSYVAMARHMIHGLSIMHEFRTRCTFAAVNQSMPEHDQTPQLDVFIIKLFAAPCMFADHSASTATTVAVCPMSLPQQSFETRNLSAIAPDTRAALTKIASKALQFLARASNPESADPSPEAALQVASLLDALQSWLIDLELTQPGTRRNQPKPLSKSFMRFFHQILRTILLSMLNSSGYTVVELGTEIDCLYELARHIEEGLKSYRMST